MESTELKKLLTQFKNGEIGEGAVLDYLRRYETESLGFANVDHHRSLRKGFPEVIYCPGKTNERIEAIVRSLLSRSPVFLATRATPEQAAYVTERIAGLVYYSDARIITTKDALEPREDAPGTVAVVSAGTSDIPVAEEAAVTAQAIGCRVERVFDVGIAGLHRLYGHLGTMQAADVIVVVAGMEGALSSVIGGLVDRPVIAVPTSVGYGASFNGIAALLGMLNSCASGVTVVNIDNGFGAAYAACTIIRSGMDR